MTEHERQTLERTADSSLDSPRPLKSAIVVTSCIVVAILLVVGGRAMIGARAKPIDKPEAETSLTVSVIPVIQAKGYNRVIKHVGLIEPLRQTQLSFETSGKLIKVLVEEGELVEKGQHIAQLDTRSLATERASQIAMRKALYSDLENAKLTFERQQILQARDFAAGQSFDDARLLVARSEAVIEQADAAIAAIDVALDKATLRAPFDAQVGQQTVVEGSTVNAGTTVANLFELNAPVVRIGLPVEALAMLGQHTHYTINISGVDYPATLISTRNDVSARTRTIDVRLQLNVRERARPVFGQTAELSLDQYVEQPGYQVPVSALTEGEAGLWSLLLSVPDEPGSVSGSVTREHIDVLYSNGKTAFVQGALSTEAGIIRSGTHRVVPGQRVLSSADPL